MGPFNLRNPFLGDDGMPRLAPREQEDVRRRMNDVRNNQWGGRFEQPAPQPRHWSQPLRDRGVMPHRPERFGGLQPLPLPRNFNWRDSVQRLPLVPRNFNYRDNWQTLPFMQNPLDRLARGDFDRFG